MVKAYPTIEVCFILAYFHFNNFYLLFSVSIPNILELYPYVEALTKRLNT